MPHTVFAVIGTDINYAKLGTGLRPSGRSANLGVCDPFSRRREQPVNWAPQVRGHVARRLLLQEMQLDQSIDEVPLLCRQWPSSWAPRPTGSATIALAMLVASCSVSRDTRFADASGDTTEVGACQSQCDQTPDLCAREGWCSADVSTGSCRCIAATDADCQRAAVCLERFFCHAYKGQCVAKPITDTKGNPTANCGGPCLWRGKCSLENGYCVALTDFDCQQSLHCRLFGMCRACRAHAECQTLVGGFVNDQCVTGSVEDCESSLDCKLGGRCSLVTTENGTKWCGAKTADDCGKSERCSSQGQCTPTGNGCIASSASECAASLGCKEADRCKLDAVGGVCAK